MLRFLDWAEQATEDRVQNAMLGAVNPTVEIWAILMTVADGTGWRLVLRRNAMQLQAMVAGGDSAPARLHQ
jgi:putative component of toxin-antitoxin plasmid stabilization module